MADTSDQRGKQPEAVPKPATSGVFVGGQFHAVATPPIEPVKRRLPAISGDSALDYIRVFSEARRIREE